jgi:hypothetical protein
MHGLASVAGGWLHHPVWKGKVMETGKPKRTFHIEKLEERIPPFNPQPEPPAQADPEVLSVALQKVRENPAPAATLAALPVLQSLQGSFGSNGVR